jgi:hypothetical protein
MTLIVVAAALVGWWYFRQYYIERAEIPATYVSAYVAYDVFKHTKCGYLAKSESGIESALNDVSHYMDDRAFNIARRYAYGPGREALERALNKGLSELTVNTDQESACRTLLDQVMVKIKTGNEIWAKAKQTWPRVRG